MTNTQALFMLLFVPLANWGRLKLIVSTIGRTQKLKDYKNDKLCALLKNKTGLNFEIKISPSSKINAYSPSLPLKPLFVLTKGAIANLTDDELKWLALHEAGHCVLWHTPKIILLHILFIATGILISSKINSLPALGTSMTFSPPLNGGVSPLKENDISESNSSPLSGVFLGSVIIAWTILWYQVEKRFEKQADSFALERTKKPKTIIAALGKIRKSNNNIFYTNPILATLLTPHPTYNERIESVLKKANGTKPT